MTTPAQQHAAQVWANIYKTPETMPMPITTADVWDALPADARTILEQCDLDMCDDIDHDVWTLEHARNTKWCALHPSIRREIHEYTNCEKMDDYGT